MWARTVSTWMMGTGGTEAPKLMVRKLSPAPNTSTQSAWSIMRRPIVWENDPQNAQVVRMAVEHVLAAGRGHQQGADLLRQGLQRLLRPRSMSAEPSHDDGTRLLLRSAAAESMDCWRAAAGSPAGMSRAAAGSQTSTFAIWTLVGRSSAASAP